MTEKQENPGFLTKEAFEKLLTKAAHPIKSDSSKLPGPCIPDVRC